MSGPILKWWPTNFPLITCIGVVVQRSFLAVGNMLSVNLQNIVDLLTFIVLLSWWPDLLRDTRKTSSTPLRQRQLMREKYSNLIASVWIAGIRVKVWELENISNFDFWLIFKASGNRKRDFRHCARPPFFFSFSSVDNH